MNATGQLLRRKGIIKGLDENGITTKLINCGSGLDDVAILKSMMNDILPSDKTVTIIEGFEFAYFLKKHISLRNCLVDICDSRVLLAAIDPKNRPNPIFRKFRKTLKSLRNGLRLRSLYKQSQGLIYISPRDSFSDRRYLSKLSRVHILPNGVQQASSHTISFDPEGDFLVTGNWAYAPNLEMLDRSIEILTDERIRKGRTLVIVGPNLNLSNLESRSWIRYLGWVENVSDIYRGIYGLLAPIEQGGGVKNKVLEAIAHGIPVFGSSEAFASIPHEILSGSSSIEDLLNFSETLSVNLDGVRERLEDCAMRSAKYSWKNAVGDLLKDLR